MSYDHVIYEKKGHVAYVTLNRPERMNALDKDSHRELNEIFDDFAADANAFCEAIRPVEELCYVEHRFNDQLVPLAKQHNILGMNIDPPYGGRGADAGRVHAVRGVVRGAGAGVPGQRSAAEREGEGEPSHDYRNQR